MFTFDCALELIGDKPEFTVRDRGSYSVIDYNLKLATTFEHIDPAAGIVLRNLRGTAFDNSTRQIIRLGWHTFYNLGEKPIEDAAINWSADHSITTKLDGSAIFPIYSREGIILGTRAGPTEQSAQADAHVAANPQCDYANFFADCRALQVTPLLEWCSRNNRIVIDYDVDQLVLLGVRSHRTGTYWSRSQLIDAAATYSIPLVHAYPSTNPSQVAAFLKTIEELHNDEGVVIQFDSGHIIKCKSAEYRLCHRALDNLKFSKDLIIMHLSNLLDDVMPILNDVSRTRVNTYLTAFDQCWVDTLAGVEHEYTLVSHIESAKEFAMTIVNSPFKHLFFAQRNKNISFSDSLTAWAIKLCSNQAGARELEEFLGVDVEY